ncbi:uncharacterized protein LY79DRAFT_705709 [Colletotrichum navitas]|uniref:RING-type domain-containing protein n=1 Tax=Colletotrichum navitas TaxID=681940 RepID=A0AAD8PSR6_9PEZI|nr:uncharacterized protein LY79DRAFT_705709 [Colletotrichum navitas]KAK1580036.1 hypothetical protein LY79DRAFT_705709 [Colletotrichum navitas]
MDRLNLDALRNLSLRDRSGGSSRGSSRPRSPSEASSDCTVISDGPPALERLRRTELEEFGPERVARARIAEAHIQEQLRLRPEAYAAQWGRTPDSVAGSTASWANDVPASYPDPRSGSRSVAGGRARPHYGSSVAGSVTESVTSSVSSRHPILSGYGDPTASNGSSHPKKPSSSYTLPANGGSQTKAFWPAIKHLLTSQAVLDEYTLPCPRCSIAMSAAEAGAQHRAMILCCGHMLCEGCVASIAANERQCPFCAVPVGKYVDCAGSCKNPGMMGLGLPSTMDELRRLPRTISEGASLPGCCPKCRILRIERDTRKLVRHILNDARARSVWNPSNDHKIDSKDYSDYVRVPELDRFLAVLRDTTHSAEIHRHYTWLQPDHRNNYAQVWAEKRDYTRPRPGHG